MKGNQYVQNIRQSNERINYQEDNFYGFDTSNYSKARTEFDVGFAAYQSISPSLTNKRLVVQYEPEHNYRYPMPTLPSDRESKNKILVNREHVRLNDSFES